MKALKVGIIGFGTVGTGVYNVLQDFKDIEIKKIAVKNINKKRNIENFDETLLTDNPYEIVNNPEIDVVIEVAGGVNPTYDVLKTAIQNKKHIVTANKELLAKEGSELFRLAKENGVIILYEAAVAGGIPIIMPIKTILCANKITKIAAILNGTTNYILTKMGEKELSYDVAHCHADITNCSWIQKRYARDEKRKICGRKHDSCGRRLCGRTFKECWCRSFLSAWNSWDLRCSSFTVSFGTPNY